jgi:hypothetical protein
MLFPSFKLFANSKMALSLPFAILLLSCSCSTSSPSSNSQSSSSRGMLSRNTIPEQTNNQNTNLPSTNATTENDPDIIEKSQEKIEKASASWFYGQGLGETVLNVSGVILYPPFGI